MFESFWKIPKRSIAIKQILKLIDENPNDEIYIEGEMLGLELIYISISKQYKCKIHVTERKWKQLQAIPTIIKYFTNNSSQSRFHVCPHKTFTTLLARKKEELKRKKKSLGEKMIDNSKSSLFIKPSTMWFASQRTKIPDLEQFYKNPIKSDDAWVRYKILY